jgi:hypothetical protein
MSTVNNGPQIVRNGLVLDLDASYMRSYSPNVHPNPIDPYAWAVNGGGYQMTLSRDTTITRQYGSIPLKIVTSGTSAYTGTYGNSNWNLAPAANGQTWTFSFWTKGSSNYTASAMIFEANSSGGYIALGQTFYNVTTSWTRVSGSYTFSNASAAYVQFRIDNYNNGVTQWVDGIQIERASSATTFNPYYFGNTVWKDVSGNNRTATLTNGPLFNSSNGGNIIFDGVDDYAIIPSGGSYSEYTFMFFCKWISNTANGSRIFGCDAFGTYTIFTPSNVAFHYNQVAGSTTVVSSGINVGLGTWCHVAVTVSALSSIAYIYINGLLTNGSTSIPYINLSGNLFLGAQNTNLLANCNIGLFQLYNRVLSAKEIMQNFQTDKSRFGL